MGLEKFTDILSEASATANQLGVYNKVKKQIQELGIKGVSVNYQPQDGFIRINVDIPKLTLPEDDSKIKAIMTSAKLKNVTKVSLGGGWGKYSYQGDYK